LLELGQKIDSFEARLRRVEQSPHNADNSIADAEPDPTENDELMTLPQPTRKPELEDHRTAPHKLLLLWPSVRPLLTAAGVEVNMGYVLEAEDRGILRLWTRGEGIDENDGTQPGGPASPAQSDESGEGTSALTPHADGLWGAGFPSTPSSDTRRSEYSSQGGLKPNGELDVDVGTMNTLFDSYVKHIHILHPILDKRRLRRMFDKFILRYSTPKPRATFAVGSAYDADGQRPVKRQRSNGSSANVSFESEVRKEYTERSPGNAIIYLVLALGKICMHKEPLPSPVRDSRSSGLMNPNVHVVHQITASSPFSADVKHSPTSPKSTPTAQPTPPSEAALRMFDGRSRRSSVEGSSTSSTSSLRNLDVIPGLAYYAKAAEILGDQGDGNDLVHAQMFLLAGIYKGQLARVKESMSWITMAGRAVQALLDRYKLYNNDYWQTYGDVRQQYRDAQDRIKDTRQSLIVLTSWSCLQLESDILAELRLPSSNIQSIENLLIMPKKAPEEETYGKLEISGGLEHYDHPDNILMFYTAQLYIRRRLNKIHNEMYGRDSLSRSLSEVQDMLLGHEEVLEAWRQRLPVYMKWHDDDPPPSDILSARLRAKYWGARYVANRPFLDYALHIMPYVKGGKQAVEEVALDIYGNKRDQADIHLFKAIEQMGEKRVWHAARSCVNAAMHSTVAFDGIPARLIMTNIHGTAHAQFGNMLVLSACHQSYLKSLVPTDRFQVLMERTIKFLRRLAPISPTCAADCGILEKFNHTIFRSASAHPGVYRNEGVAPTIMQGHSSFSQDLLDDATERMQAGDRM